MNYLRGALIFLMGYLPLPVHAQDAKTTALQFEERDYGLCNSRDTKVYNLSNSPTAHVTGADTIIFYKRTDSVAAQLGISFGVSYRLKMAQDTTLPVAVVWDYPKGMKDSEGKDLPQTAYRIMKETNQDVFAFYRFDVERELLKGTWTLRLFTGHILLYQHEFIVY